MSYSIILPSYKEAKNLDIIIDQIQKYMNKKFFLVFQFILRSSNVDTNRSSRRMG